MEKWLAEKDVPLSFHLKSLKNTKWALDDLEVLMGQNAERLDFMEVTG